MQFRITSPIDWQLAKRAASIIAWWRPSGDKAQLAASKLAVFFFLHFLHLRKAQRRKKAITHGFQAHASRKKKERRKKNWSRRPLQVVAADPLAPTTSARTIVANDVVANRISTWSVTKRRGDTFCVTSFVLSLSTIAETVCKLVSTVPFDLRSKLIRTKTIDVYHYYFSYRESFSSQEYPTGQRYGNGGNQIGNLRENCFFLFCFFSMNYFP